MQNILQQGFSIFWYLRPNNSLWWRGAVTLQTFGSLPGFQPLGASSIHHPVLTVGFSPDTGKCPLGDEISPGLTTVALQLVNHNLASAQVLRRGTARLITMRTEPSMSAMAGIGRCYLGCDISRAASHCFSDDLCDKGMPCLLTLFVKLWRGIIISVVSQRIL